jgi:F-type H+-transporting ATPase subunit delta
MKDLRALNDVATALVTMAAEKHALPQVLDDIRTVEEACQMDARFLSDLTHPGISLEHRIKALSTALEKEVHPFLTNALLVLLQKNLLSELPTFAAAVRKAAIKEGSREAHVVSAIELTETERKEIVTMLEKKFDATVRLRESRDPTLLGGFVLTMGDWRFDGSVKGRIDRLTHELYV